MSDMYLNLCGKLVPQSVIFTGDVSAQWLNDSDGRPGMVALTFSREGGSADVVGDIELVLPLDDKEFDILIAMLQGARRHVELERARERARQGK